MPYTPPPDPRVPVQHVAPVLPQYPYPAQYPPRHRSRTPLWVGLGAVVVLALAAVTGIMLRPAVQAPTSGGVRATVRPWDPPSAVGTPAAPAAPSAPQQVYQGTGDDVVALRTPVRVGLIAFECGLCTSSATVRTDTDGYVLMHLSEGPYAGRGWIGMTGRTTRSVTVSAQGPWKLAVGGLDTARQVDGTTTVVGSGDDAVLMRTPPGVMHVSHTGSRNFVVEVATDQGRNFTVLVNEIGPYTGTVPVGVPADAALVNVAADGDWTLAPR